MKNNGNTASVNLHIKTKLNFAGLDPPQELEIEKNIPPYFQKIKNKGRGKVVFVLQEQNTGMLKFVITIQ